MKHEFYECAKHAKSRDRCAEGRCHFCEGGLTLCVICNGAEASLPSECPGRKMTAAEEDAVQAGDLNFIGAKWRVTRDANHP